jgi:DNA-binding transcriptional LysR family regulator
MSLEDRIVDIAAEGFDLALRVSQEDLPVGLLARRVRPVRFLIAASREYLKRNGIPRSPEELSRHNCVAIGDFDTWPLTGAKGTIEVPARVVLRFRSVSGVADAVAAGIGIAPLPEVYLEDPAFRDVLTPVLPDYPLRKATLYAVYASRRYIPLKIRGFIDHLLEYVAKTAPRDNSL